MPELNFHVTGVEAPARGLAPLLRFTLRITASMPVQALILNVQIQIQSPQRGYTPAEKKKLVELFGPPEKWSHTLRNRLWTHATVTTGAFEGETEAGLQVPCSYDLNLSASKYFDALEGGEVPLLFLFSGSVFHSNAEGRLQVERISWDKECVYRMPAETWRGLMEAHYPNSAWVYLRRDAFERLCEYKRESGLATWEAVVDSLIESAGAPKNAEDLQKILTTEQAGRAEVVA
ncbi:MAG TPA: DUF6084 family protein [Verrucomicrobiae bacterium]|nr:DUF6084 family protein [Verrucomicrobiae bacterium]